MSWETVAQSISASGPLAIVLAAGCVVLWRAYQESNRAHIQSLIDIAKGAQKSSDSPKA